MAFAMTALNLWAVPYNHESVALKVLALIFWITGVIILFAFLGMTVARFYMFPGMWTKVLNHPEESVYLTCITMSFVPIINLISYAHLITSFKLSLNPPGCRNGLFGWMHLFGPNSHKLLYLGFALWLGVNTAAYALTFVIFYRMSVSLGLRCIVGVLNLLSGSLFTEIL